MIRLLSDITYTPAPRYPFTAFADYGTTLILFIIGVVALAGIVTVFAVLNKKKGTKNKIKQAEEKENKEDK